ncbi:MAG: hypothetical protein ACPLRU_01625 [Desulfofundulus sp.]
MNGELSALWDRFDLRYVVNYIRDERSFAAMLSLNGKGAPRTTISLDEVRQAQQEAAVVNVPEPMIQALVNLWKELKQNGIIVSDRRFRNTLRFLKANAWLAGRNEVTDDDVEVLPNLLWQEPEQIRLVKKVVLAFSNPFVVKADEIYDGAVEIINKVKEMPDSPKQSEAAAEAHHKLKQAIKVLENLAAEAFMQGKSPERVTARAKQLEAMNKELVKKFLVFDL